MYARYTQTQFDLLRKPIPDTEEFYPISETSILPSGIGLAPILGQDGTWLDCYQFCEDDVVVFDDMEIWHGEDMPEGWSAGGGDE